MRYASFSQRVAALIIDLGILAIGLVVIVYALNALQPLGFRPFTPFWETPEVIDTRTEPVGAPSTEKHEGGIERTVAYSRVTRIYADGALRIFAVIEASARMPDGTVTGGTAETLIGENVIAYWRLRATYALFALVALIYYGLFEASSRQATPGKQLFRLKVANLEGHALSPVRAALRQLAKFVTLAMSGFGYLTALFTMRHQTIHDVIAGTVVLSGRRTRRSDVKVSP